MHFRYCFEIRFTVSFPVKWYDKEKSILYCRFVSPWTWDEAEEGTETIIRMLRSIEHDCAVLVDTRNWGRIPDNSLVRLKGLMRPSEPNTTHVIIIGNTTLVRNLLNFVTRLLTDRSYTQQYRFVSNIEEAVSFLDEYRSDRSIIP